MKELSEKVICTCCGQEVFKRQNHLKNFYKYNRQSKDLFVQSLMDLEGASKEVATSWAEHGLFEQCKKATRNCPACGNELKTWRAKLCLACGASFQPWTRIS